MVNGLIVDMDKKQLMPVELCTLTVTGKAVAGTNVKKNFRKYIEYAMNTNGDIG